MDAARLHLVETTPEAEEQPSPGMGEDEIALPGPSPAVDPLAESGDPLEVPGYGQSADASIPAPEIVGDPLVGQPEPTPDDAADDAFVAGLEAPDPTYPPEYAETVADIQAHVQAFDNLLEYGDPYKSGVERVRLFNKIEQKVREAGGDVDQFWEEWQAARPYLSNGTAEQPSAPTPNPIEAMLDQKIGPIVEYVQEQRQREDGELARQELVAMYDGAFNALKDQIVSSGQKPPDPIVFGSTMVRLGLLGNPQIDPETATRLCWDHLRGQAPTQSAPSRIVSSNTYSPRNPRGSISIPIGPTATNAPTIREVDPIDGSRL